MMPLDRSFLGRTYPLTEPYEVGREKIREFADAIGDPNPVYRDRAAAQALGYPDVIAPPTFVILLSLRASHQVVKDPAFGMDYSKVVHGEQKFYYQRPIRAGDVLRVRSSVEDVRVAGDNELLTTKGEVFDADGELVVTAFSTVLARGTAESSAQASAEVG
jgi:acyl dehydratase